MVDQRDQLSREVDEELRREQLLKLWEQYGTYAIAVAVLIIVGIGGVKYYQYRDTLAAQAAGSRLVAATHQAPDKAQEVRKELETIAATSPTGYATLARLRIAATDSAAGKTLEAATEFESIAKDGGVDPLLKDYAKLQAAMLRLDTANWTDMQNRLNDLAAEGNPWRYSARELLGLAAYKAGRAEEARQEFQRLMSDRATPQGIAERARMMMGVLAQAELTKTAPVPEQPVETPVAPEPKTKTKPEGKKQK
jgi:hypothetical protein